MMDKTALVIDDEFHILDLMEMILTDLGYKTVKAYDALEGLSILKVQRPDIILCDIMLPNMSGLDFARMLKEDADTRSIPIVLMSAGRPQLETNPADDFLAKPFDLNVLESTIQKHTL